MEFQKQGHAVYYTRYHVVLTTKYRRKIFKGGLAKYLQAKIMEVTKFYLDIQVLEANTDGRSCAFSGVHSPENGGESGVFRSSSFYADVISDSGRVLKPGGQLVIWRRIPLTSFDAFIDVITVAAKFFDIESTSMLVDGIESLIFRDFKKSKMSGWMYKF